MILAHDYDFKTVSTKENGNADILQRLPRTVKSKLPHAQSSNSKVDKIQIETLNNKVLQTIKRS